MTTVREDYVLDKECKHSVCYKPKVSGSKLSGMSVYVPKALLNDKKPKTIVVSVEIPS